MSQSTFVVTGASGQIGRALTERLLTQGHTVRAVARHADGLRQLAAQGAEAHVGSVGDREFLTRALTGADGVFLMVPPDYQSNEMLATQRAVVEAEVAAVQASGVRRVVALSSIGAHRASGTGPIVTLHNFEQQLATLAGVDVVALRAAYFMENLLQNVDLVRGMGINGTAAQPEATLPMVATADIAAVAADRLTQGDFSGQSVRYVLGPRDVTFAEVTRVLGAAIGKPDLPYVAFSYEDTLKALNGAGLPPTIAALIVEMYAAINDGLLAPTQPRSAENTTPTSLEQWAPVFAAAYRGKAATA
jgi:uncharacterized protein YbjT (DUF2867 family)